MRYCFCSIIYGGGVLAKTNNLLLPYALILLAANWIAPASFLLFTAALSHSSKHTTAAGKLANFAALPAPPRCTLQPFKLYVKILKLSGFSGNIFCNLCAALHHGLYSFFTDLPSSLVAWHQIQNRFWINCNCVK